MDISMPHMNGVEATTRIRAELPDILIFALSMHSRGAASEEIEQAGAAGFFVKGIDMDRLIEHLLAVQASRRTGNPAGRQGGSSPRPAHG
jgi:DNA-binding NarL/FixJ family response regulator